MLYVLSSCELAPKGEFQKEVEKRKERPENWKAA
jgi:hypothetical protein